MPAELLKINGYRAPRDKVICILNCCKVIFGAFDYYEAQANSPPSVTNDLIK